MAMTVFYALDDQCLIPGAGKVSTFATMSRPAQGPIQPSIQYFSRVERPERESSH
jgi:hypothetical protein